MSGEAAPPTWEVAAGKPESSILGDADAARVRELYAAVLAGSHPLLARRQRTGPPRADGTFVEARAGNRLRRW